MPWFFYLLKVSVCMVPFYLIFALYLQKLTYFSWNRAYLLLSLAISWVIPLLRFHLPQTAQTMVLQWVEPPGKASSNGLITSYSQFSSTASVFPLENIILLIYCCGVVFLLLRLTFNVWRIIHLATKQEHIQPQTPVYRIVHLEGRYANSSFFHTIFVDSKNLSPEEQEQVIAHEKCHIYYMHSIDIIIVEVVKAILWFNPIIYFYQKSLQLIHEFEADAKATDTANKQAYAELLLKLNSNSVAALMHPFNKRPLSRRVHMLFHKKSTTMQKFAYLLSIPVLVTGVFLFSCTTDRDKEFPVPIVYSDKVLSGSGDPFLMIDLREYPYHFIKQIKPEDISSVEIYNGMEMASHWFGGKAKNGAIFIRTKKMALSENIKVGFCTAKDKYVQLSTKPGKGEKRYRLIATEAGNAEFSAEFGEGIFTLNGTEYDTEQIMSLDLAFLNKLMKTHFTAEAEKP